jgi:hypothetical protein
MFISIGCRENPLRALNLHALFASKKHELYKYYKSPKNKVDFLLYRSSSTLKHWMIFLL